MKRQRWIRTCLLQSIPVALGMSGWTPSTLRAQTSPPEILVETKLVAGDGMAADQFGEALAVSGDVLVTSAPSAVVDGKQSTGTAYVFVRDPATAAWAEQKKLLPQDGAAFDQFGTNVAVDGETLVPSAPRGRTRAKRRIRRLPGCIGAAAGLSRPLGGRCYNCDIRASAPIDRTGGRVKG